MTRNEVREHAGRRGYSASAAAFDADGLTMPVALSWHGPTWGTHGTVVELTWQQVDALIAAYPNATIAAQARRDVADWRTGRYWLPYKYNLPGLCRVIADHVQTQDAAQ